MDTSTMINILIALVVILFFYKQFAPIKGVRTINAKEFEQERKSAQNAILIASASRMNISRGTYQGRRIFRYLN